MLECHNEYSDAIENDKNVDIIFYDIAKAFDSINHNILLTKLYNVGISGSLLGWIESFLTNRNFRVIVNNTFSNVYEAPSGVPQGTILGPLLFNFYISSLSNFDINEIVIELFADGLKSFIVYKKHESTDPLQNFISKFADWCALNKLKVAADKCFVLHLGKNNPNRQYYFNNTPIKKENLVRDLGLMTNSNLKWNDQFDLMCTKAYGRLFSLFRAVRSNDPHFLFRMYKTYVRPILEFGTAIACPIYKKEIFKIEKVQKTAVNIIYYRSLKYKYPTKPPYLDILKLHNSNTLEFRRHINDLVLYHKIKYGIIKVHENCLPKFCTPTSIRGVRGAPFIPFCKTNIRYNFFLNRIGRIYAKLPCNFVNEPCIPTFKTQLIRLNQNTVESPYSPPL